MERGSFRVLPESNRLLGDNTIGDIRSTGLGKWSRLKDNVIVDFLSLCDAQTLLAFATSSKAFYLLSGLECLWRDLVLFLTNGNNLSFHVNWKTTFLYLKTGQSLSSDVNRNHIVNIKSIQDSILRSHNSKLVNTSLMICFICFCVATLMSPVFVQVLVFLPLCHSILVKASLFTRHHDP